MMYVINNLSNFDMITDLTNEIEGRPFGVYDSQKWLYTKAVLGNYIKLDEIFLKLL